MNVINSPVLWVSQGFFIHICVSIINDVSKRIASIVFFYCRNGDSTGTRNKGDHITDRCISTTGSQSHGPTAVYYLPLWYVVLPYSILQCILTALLFLYIARKVFEG